jgi:hypothetical protein
MAHQMAFNRSCPATAFQGSVLAVIINKMILVEVKSIGNDHRRQKSLESNWSSLENAETGQVGPSTHMYGKPTNQELATW